MTLVDWGSLFPHGHLSVDLDVVLFGVDEAPKDFSVLPVHEGSGVVVTFRMELVSFSE